jgi:hypothetical protein
MGTRGSFPGGKAVGAWIWHIWPPTSAEVKNMRVYTSTSLYRKVRGLRNININFSFLFWKKKQKRRTITLLSLFLCIRLSVPLYEAYEPTLLSVCWLYIFPCGPWFSPQTTNSLDLSHFEMPHAAHSLKNFPTFYGTRIFMAVFTRALHWSILRATSIQCLQSQRISLQPFVILQSY